MAKAIICTWQKQLRAIKENNMAIRKQDARGQYRDYDPNTGSFLDEDEFALGSRLGQMEHQMATTNKGRIIDRDHQAIDEVYENGEIVVNEDEAKIRTYVKQAISVDSLVGTFKDNSHETLLKLLALQDNKHPLKRGGVGIAYRTDALIMHCKMEFSSEENVVFDAILGTISSFPENRSYRIEPATFVKFSKYQNEKTIYDVFRKGTNKLSDRILVFEGLGPDGKDDIKVPWFDILRYHKKEKDKVAYIEFAPSDFFKDLALCSGLVHGAFGSIEVTTQLQGKYAIALYWYLENMKNYKEYPGATPGIFDMTTEELKHQFSIPESYIKGEIERRVLKPARDSINAIAECDFTFDYEAKYVDKKHVGYRFEVKSKNYIESTATEILEIEEKEDDPLKEQIAQTAMLLGIAFSDDEVARITSCARRENKDIAYLMQVLATFNTRNANKELDEIEDRVGYICAMISQGVSQNPKKASTKKKNSFNNFQQRDYDMDELEKKLLK